MMVNLSRELDETRDHLSHGPLACVWRSISLRLINMGRCPHCEYHHPFGLHMRFYRKEEVGQAQGFTII